MAEQYFLDVGFGYAIVVAIFTVVIVVVVIVIVVVGPGLIIIFIALFIIISLLALDPLTGIPAQFTCTFRIQVLFLIYIDICGDGDGHLCRCDRLLLLLLRFDESRGICSFDCVSGMGVSIAVDIIVVELYNIFVALLMQL